MARMESRTRLERSQRVQSSSALSSTSGFDSFQLTPLSSINSTPSLTRPPHRSKSASSLSALRDHTPSYSHRGFELGADPFASTSKTESRSSTYTFPARSKPAPRRRSTLVEKEDEVLTRFGASARCFGRWEQGEDRVDVWRSDNYESDDSLDDDDEVETSDESEEELDARQRTMSSLSVFHDAFEYADELSSPTSSPTSSTRPLPSEPSSPTTPASSVWTDPRRLAQKDVIASSAVDELAKALLGDQDRFGVFAWVESLIEWPFTSAANSLPTSKSAPALSRIPSSSTVYSSLPPTPDGFDDFYVGHSGELSAFYRARYTARLLADPGELDTESKEDGVRTLIDALAGVGSLL